MADIFRRPNSLVTWNWYRIAASVSFFALPFIAIVLPRSTHVLMAGIFVASVVGFTSRRDRVQNWVEIELISAVFILFGIYLSINALWSAEISVGLLKAGQFFLIIGTTHIFVRNIQLENDEIVRLAAKAMVCGILVGGVYLAIDLLSDQYLTISFYNQFPALQLEGTKHQFIENGIVISLRDYQLNRNTAVFCLMLWPATLVLSGWDGSRRNKFFILLVALLTAIIIMNTEHESSILAVVFAVIIFGLAKWKLKFASRFTKLMWAAAVILVVPAVLLAHKAELQHAKWLPSSAKARAILWDFTARKVLENPILGVGIRSTKTLDRRQRQSAKILEGDNYPQRTGRHSHNLFLQTWYELGAIGAILLLLAGLALINWIDRQSRFVQPYAYAAFTTAATIAAFSWGIWQSWYMSALGMSASFLYLAKLAVEQSSRLQTRTVQN